MNSEEIKDVIDHHMRIYSQANAKAIADSNASLMEYINKKFDEVTSRVLFKQAIAHCLVIVNDNWVGSKTLMNALK